MSRIRCHTAMRVLVLPLRIIAALIAAVITLADWLMMILAFVALSVLSLMPERASASDDSNSEWPLLPVATALVAVLAFVATHFWPWGFAQ